MTRPTQRRHTGLPAVWRRNQPEQHAGQRPGQGPDATGGAGWSGLHAFKSTAVPLMPPSAGPRPGPCWSNSWFDQFGGLYLNAGSGRGRPCCRLGRFIKGTSEWLQASFNRLTLSATTDQALALLPLCRVKRQAVRPQTSREQAHQDHASDQGGRSSAGPGGAERRHTARA